MTNTCFRDSLAIYHFFVAMMWVMDSQKMGGSSTCVQAEARDVRRKIPFGVPQSSVPSSEAKSDVPTAGGGVAVCQMSWAKSWVLRPKKKQKRSIHANITERKKLCRCKEKPIAIKER